MKTANSDCNIYIYNIYIYIRPTTWLKPFQHQAWCVTHIGLSTRVNYSSPILSGLIVKDAGIHPLSTPRATSPRRAPQDGVVATKSVRHPHVTTGYGRTEYEKVQSVGNAAPLGRSLPKDMLQDGRPHGVSRHHLASGRATPDPAKFRNSPESFLHPHGISWTRAFNRSSLRLASLHLLQALSRTCRMC